MCKVPCFHSKMTDLNLYAMSELLAVRTFGSNVCYPVKIEIPDQCVFHDDSVVENCRLA